MKDMLLRRFLCFWIIFNFLFTFVIFPQKTYAQNVETPLMASLPVAGVMVNLSSAYAPVLIKGLRIHPENPLLFDFIVDTGNDTRFTPTVVPGSSTIVIPAKAGIQNQEQLKSEANRLIKYFLATVTIPENDLWVNLSPYEKNRIVPVELGQTELGADMLAEDYILKQLTASLIYPEKSLGKDFWDRVYAKAREMYGTTQIPVNTFNKVWIVGDKAKVYVHDNTAFVVATHLKVMLEEDYLAMTKHNSILNPSAFLTVIPAKAGIQKNNINALSSQIIRAIILPEIEKEVNEGKNFANLRQIFYSMILATWYKRNLKEALLNQVYANKTKIDGVAIADKTIKDKIYRQYLEAYKKGVFNYIKEDANADGQQMPRKYFSGGFILRKGFLQATTDPFDADVQTAPGEFSQAMIVETKMKPRKFLRTTMDETSIRDTLMTKYSPDPVVVLYADLAGTLLKVKPSSPGSEDVEFEPMEEHLREILINRLRAGSALVLATGDRFRSVEKFFLPYIPKELWSQIIVLSQSTMLSHQYDPVKDVFRSVYNVVKKELTDKQRRKWIQYQNRVRAIVKGDKDIEDDKNPDNDKHLKGDNYIEGDKYLGKYEKEITALDGTHTWFYQWGKIMRRSHQLTTEVYHNDTARRNFIMEEMKKRILQQEPWLQEIGFFDTRIGSAGGAHIDITFIPGFNKEKGLDMLKNSGAVERILKNTGVLKKLKIRTKGIAGKYCMALGDSFGGNDGPLGEFVHRLGGEVISVGEGDVRNPKIAFYVIVEEEHSGPLGSADVLTKPKAGAIKSEMRTLRMSDGFKRLYWDLEVLHDSQEHTDRPDRARDAFAALGKYIQGVENANTKSSNITKFNYLGEPLVMRAPVRLFDAVHGAIDLKKINKAVWLNKERPGFKIPMLVVVISNNKKVYIDVTVDGAGRNQRGKIVYVNQDVFPGEHVTSGNVKIGDNGLVPDGHNDAADLVAQLFGLRGLKITVNLPPDEGRTKGSAKRIKKGGWGRSSIYLKALLLAFKELTGADLTDGDLHALLLALSNGPLDDGTGGQEALATSLGNVQMFFEAGREVKGKRTNPNGVTIKPLWKTPHEAKGMARKISRHVRFLEFKPPIGTAISRNAELNKYLWEVEATYDRKFAIPRFDEMNEQAYRYADGMRHYKLDQIIASLLEGARLRNELTIRPINALFDFYENPQKLAQDQISLAKRLDKGPLKKLYDESSPVKRNTIRKGLFSYGQNEEMIEYAFTKLGIGMTHTGAGGSGARVLAFAKNPKNFRKLWDDWKEKDVFEDEFFASDIGHQTIEGYWKKPKGKPVPIELSSARHESQTSWLLKSIKNRSLSTNIVTITDDIIEKARNEEVIILGINSKRIRPSDYDLQNKKGFLYAFKMKNVEQKPVYVLVKASQIKMLLNLAMKTQGPGGIDLNAKNLQMDIQQDNAMEMKFNAAMIAQFKKGDFSGVSPEILDITPLPRNYFTKYFTTV